jgi:ornithine cyclodeaminase
VPAAREQAARGWVNLAELVAGTGGGGAARGGTGADGTGSGTVASSGAGSVGTGSAGAASVDAVPSGAVPAGAASVPLDRPRFFKSVGMAWQDLAVAAAAYREWRRSGSGEGARTSRPGEPVVAPAFPDGASSGMMDRP